MSPKRFATERIPKPFYLHLSEQRVIWVRPVGFQFLSAKLHVKMAQSQVPIGDWVDELLNKVFFQPDDSIANAAYAEGFSENITIKLVRSSFKISMLI